MTMAKISKRPALALHGLIVCAECKMTFLSDRGQNRGGQNRQNRGSQNRQNRGSQNRQNRGGQQNQQNRQNQAIGRAMAQTLMSMLRDQF